MLCVGLYVWFYIAFVPSLWFLLLIPIHGVIINWFAHKYGVVNQETDNTSTNLFKEDWLMLGEGYHNNHHKFPARTNFATHKGEFGFCYPIIFLLDKLKVIQVAM